MTTIDSDMVSLPSLREDLVSRLARFGKRVRAHLVIEGVARVVVEVIALCAVSLILDWMLRLGRPVRMVLLAGGLGLVLYEIWHSVLQPSRLRLRPVELAAVLDRHRGT